ARPGTRSAARWVPPFPTKSDELIGPRRNFAGDSPGPSQRPFSRQRIAELHQAVRQADHIVFIVPDTDIAGPDGEPARDDGARWDVSRGPPPGPHELFVNLLEVGVPEGPRGPVPEACHRQVRLGQRLQPRVAAGKFG